MIKFCVLVITLWVRFVKMAHVRPLTPLVEYKRRKALRKAPALRQLVQTNLPASLSWRSRCAPIYDQAQMGTCTSNSYCFMVRTLKIQANPSRYFHYACERLHEKGGVLLDLGADLVLDSQAAAIGVCDEKFMPYI